MLSKDVAAVWVDELRQQREIKQGDLGIEQIGEETHRQQLSNADRRQTARGEERSGAGPHRLPGQPQQIGGARILDRVIEERHGKGDRGQAEGCAQDEHDEAQDCADQRDRASLPALTERARNQIDHVRPGRENQPQAQSREGQQRLDRHRHRYASQRLRRR
jgi:hypothetical protein